MGKFDIKGNITCKDFMMQVLNNLPEEYDVIIVWRIVLHQLAQML